MPEKGRPTVAVCFKGRVTDARSGASVGADIKVVSLKDGAVVANTSSDAKNGDYIVSLPSGEEYAFLVSAKGYLFHSQNVVEKGGDAWSPTVVDIGLKPIVKGESIALRNVFFETGRFVLLPQSEYELDKVVELLQQNKSLKVELGGHTDNVGQPQANQKLSEQRAKAVYEYLVKKGVDASRLIYKGYGETKPVAGNDTEEGRAANRRTEMKILEG